MLLLATKPALIELTSLVQRLARLVQEMGDRGLEPDAYKAAPALRPRYLHLTRQAQHLAQTLGFTEAEASEYVTKRLLEQLRASSRTERRADMSLQQALGE